jgi:hypothetical protein
VLGVGLQSVLDLSCHPLTKSIKIGLKKPRFKVFVVFVVDVCGVCGRPPIFFVSIISSFDEIVLCTIPSNTYKPAARGH